MKRISALVALLLLFGTTSAEETPLRASLDQGRPLAELPAHVEAGDGKVSLFADFNDIRGEHIVLYLVNKTGKELPIEAQDGDVYMKLEAKVMHGLYERAQGHTYSWCGNSYFPMTLKPDTFYTILGYYPSEGELREVRYRTYKNEGLVSNVGQGRVNPAEVKQAKSDRMAIETGDFEFVSQIALGKREVGELAGHWKNARHIAVYSLGRFPRDKAEPVLKKLLDDDDEQVRQTAAAVLSSFGG